MSMIRLLALVLAISSTTTSAVEVLGAVRAVDQNLDKPVCITWAPGDTSRMFVIEQHAGRIRIVKDGALLPTPFLTIAGVANHQEQGLLSMAFHPDYQTNGHFYVHYSDAAGDNVIARYTRLDAERADPNSARQLLWLDHPNGSDVHYGSFLGFNPRDTGDAVRKHWLYMTVGDGGGGNYPSGQNPATLFGKILRVDVDPARFGGAAQEPYGIPSGNTPITSGALPEIIAMGVRNPWRGSFDRTTGDFWFGDIGDTTYEEVNRIPYNALHLNFQWPAKEGSFVHNNPPATIGVITEPVHFFNRGAVIGGAVYRGNELPGWRGRYLFADYGSNTVRCFTFTGNGTTEHRTDLMTELAAKIQFGLTRIVAFGEDANGELYFAEHMRGGANSGMVYRIRQDTDATPPTITSTPTTRATTGFTYSYQVTATGNPAATFSLTAAPSGMTITTGGLISWTPIQAQIGTHTVSVRAANGTLPNATQTFDLVVSGQRAADHPLTTTALVGGLEYSYYEGVWADIPALVGLTPTRTGTVAQPDLSPTHRASDYAFRYTGYVKAEVAGLYAFSTTSDDGSMLYVGDDLVVDNHGPHGAVTVNGTIGLAAGWHRITVHYHQLGGGAVMGAGWTPPGGSASAIPVAAFARLATPYGLDGYGGATPYLGMPRTVTGALPTTLSATGTFANTATFQPAASLIPYDVNTPLWSDAAEKARWIAIPTGSRLGFDATGNWTFPPGTVLVKHFGFNNGRRLETRLLVVTDNGTAYGVTYKWRSDNSDADLLPGDAPLVETVTGPNGAQTWTYPSRANCLQCHTSAAGFVLGVRTRQLNRTTTYPTTGRSDNQLRTLGGLGLLTVGYDEGSLSSYHKLSALGDTSASLEERVRSYLDANCMNCHQPGGGAVAQFDARYTTPLTGQGIVDGAVNNTLGIANAKVVAPGDLTRSILYQRMHTTDPAIRMPTLGRSVIDQTATTVVAQWIQGLSGGTNAAPVIVLGAAPSPVAGTQATLSATVSDDGRPSGAVVTQTWSRVSGPGTVNFTTPGNLNTGATFSLAGTYVVRLSASDTQLTTIADLTVVVSAPPDGGQVVAAIDCGSTAAYTASDGTVYQADAWFTGGGVSGRGDPISGTPDQPLYRNERLGNFSYAIPVPSAGTYDVVLKSTEVWWNAAGVRLFDVTAEGQTVVSNLDLYAAAGGKFIAYDRRISVTVNDGVLNLVFITRADNAMMSAIRVERTGTGPVNTAPQVVMAAAPTAVAGIPATVSASVTDDGLPSGSTVTTTWTQVSGPASASLATPGQASTQVTFPVAGSYVLRLTASDGALSTTGTVTVVAAPPSSGGQVVVAIDSGSTGAYTASDGTVYQADQWFTPSATTGRGDPVSGTVDQPLYQNERFGTFGYAIPVPAPGAYEVVLSFAEVWWTAPGMRVFDVMAEGQPAITGLDIYAVTGARYRALDRRISVTVSGATLDLEFITRADNALVSAIRVERVGTPPPTAVEYKVDFGPVGAAPMSGWLPDTGAVFGDRGNGVNYGWNVVNNDTRIRNSATSPDRMHDTLNHVARGTVKSWEIAVPNGIYEVDISAGDPSFADQVNHLVVEGVAVRDGDGADNFDELAVTVTVADGRLTITQAADGVNAKLCGVHLLQLPTSNN